MGKFWSMNEFVCKIVCSCLNNIDMQVIDINERGKCDQWMGLSVNYMQCFG